MYFVVINHYHQSIPPLDKQRIITLNRRKHWWIIVKYIYWVAMKRVEYSDVSRRLVTGLNYGSQKRLVIFLRNIDVRAICCYTADCFFYVWTLKHGTWVRPLFTTSINRIFHSWPFRRYSYYDYFISLYVIF